MPRFFKKIRWSFLENRKIGKYLQYALGEIVLVVVGILIAVSINNWKRSKDLEEAEENLYGDIIQELRKDYSEIESNREYNRRYLARYETASEIILTDTLHTTVDSLGAIAAEVTNFSDFKKEQSAYDKLALSGQVELIGNEEILDRLQELSVQYNYINRLEVNQEQFMFTLVPKLAEYLRIKPFKVMQPERLYEYQFQNNMEFLIKIGLEKDELYAQTEENIQVLINLLEEEVAE